MKRPPKPFAKGPSKHYTWAEVNPRGFSGFGPVLRARAIIHARKLETLRRKVNARRAEHGLPARGIPILSWWRPRWYNDQIGGARQSQHIKATATDIDVRVIDKLMPWAGGRREFDAICNAIFKDGGFGQYPAGSRHVDSRGFRARWTSFSR